MVLRRVFLHLNPFLWSRKKSIEECIEESEAEPKSKCCQIPGCLKEMKENITHMLEQAKEGKGLYQV